MSNLVFSQKQLVAVERLDKNVIVAAQAGSGKTTLLVQRYLRAVTAEKLNPENILAITFTENAAVQMKERLSRAFEENGLRHLLSDLDNATIGTIHGFCAGLMREYPIECGVDPGFSILSEGEAELRSLNLIHHLFERESQSKEFMSLLHECTEDKLRFFLRKYYALSKTAGVLPSQAIKVNEQNKELLLKNAETLRGKIYELLSELGSRLESEKLSEAEERLCLKAKELSLLLNKAVSGWDAVAAAAAIGDSLDKRTKKLKATVEEIEVLCKSFAQTHAEILSDPLKQEFLRVYTLFYEAYESEKKQNGLYDFDDLVLCALKALTQDSTQSRFIRKNLTDKYKHVFVDEYQDTSLIQSRLIETLTQDSGFFAVGDIHQSIYGFRYAEPEVFASLLVQSYEASESLCVSLRENYRSRKEVLGFVNALFEKTFSDEFFECLQPMRTFKSGVSKAVELPLFLRNEEESEKGRLAEAHFIAERIKELVNGCSTVEEDSESRSIRYSDIAILLRASTYSYLYEKELADAGIPFYSAKGKGFYEKPEIKDFLAYLKILIDPADDIALAGVLRSPMVMLSDEGLYWLSELSKENDHERPLWNALGLEYFQNHSQMSAQDKNRLDAFLRLYKNIRRDLPELCVSKILEIILAQTQVEAKYLASPQAGKQAIANIRKLIFMAISFESRQALGLGDFIAWVAAMSDEDSTETEAKMDSKNENVVRLLTVHAAKGLEFPCVFVADMGAVSRKSQGEGMLISRQGVLGLKVKNPQTRDKVTTLKYEEILLSDEKRQDEEDKRVLYVALTRAKERLILCAQAKISAKDGSLKAEDSWIAHILETMGISGSASGTIEFGGTAVDVTVHEVARRHLLKNTSRAVSINPLSEILESGRPIDKALAEKLNLKWSDKALQSIRETLDFSKSSYAETKDFSVSSVLSSWPSVDVAEVVSVSKNEDEKLEIFEEESWMRVSANEFGTLFHAFMEHGTLQRHRVLSLFHEMEYWTKYLSQTQKEVFIAQAKAFWKSDLGKQIISSKRCYPELPFIFKTSQGLLKGRLDLVFENSAGEWVILDYKTNQISSKDKNKTAQSYEVQLKLYALVFRKIYGKVPVKALLYFSHIDEFSELTLTKASLESFELEFQNYLKQQPF